MTTSILCEHCQTPAVAELDGDYLCSGCLMNILTCLEEPIPIKRLDIIQPEDSKMASSPDFKHIYNGLS